MDIRINPVGFSVNPVLEEFINKKFSKLEKYHDGIMSIDVTLKLEKDDHLENNETVFEIKTFAGSRDEAKKIVDNWKNNAEVIYPKLLETLTQSNLHVNGDGSN